MSGVGMFLALIGVNAVSYALNSLASYFLEETYGGTLGKILYLLTIPTAIFSFPCYPVFEGIVDLYIKIAYGKFCEEAKEKEKEKEEKQREEWKKQEENRNAHMEIQIGLAEVHAAKRERAAIAQRLLAAGEPIEKITRCTGLSASEVQSLMQ